MGACSLTEIIENLEDFAEALGDLQEGEKQRLLGGARTAAHAVKLDVVQAAPRAAIPQPIGGTRQPLVTALSVPVTAGETKKAEAAMVLSLVDELRIEECFEEDEAQDEAEEEKVEEQANDEESSPKSRLDQESEVAEGRLRRLPGHERSDDDVGFLQAKTLDRRRKLKPEKFHRWDTPPKHRWRVDDGVLRARIPKEEELQAVQRAKMAAKAAVEAEWRVEEEAQGGDHELGAGHGARGAARFEARRAHDLHGLPGLRRSGLEVWRQPPRSSARKSLLEPPAGR